MRRFAIMFLALAAAAAQRDSGAEARLQAAVNKETVEGDLKSAIELYKKATQSPNRVVAAKALVRMGQCYEKLGDTEARKAYERAIREFGDQKDAIATARARLAAMGGVKSDGMSARRVFTQARRGGLAVSSDGRLLLLRPNSARGLYVMEQATGQYREALPARLAGQEGSIIGTALFFPDDRRIAFGRWVQGRSELRVAGVDGSGERALWVSTDAFGLRGWFPDGSRVLVMTFPKKGSSRLLAVSTADGSMKPLKEDAALRGAWLSPDGNYVAYVKQTGANPARSEIWVLSLADSSETPLVRHPANNGVPRWTPDGRGLLYLSDRRGTADLWRLPMAGGKPTGPPEVVRTDVGRNFWPLGFTRDGAFYYHSRFEMTEAQLGEVDPATGAWVSAPKAISPQLADQTHSPAFSADGQWLAYVRSARGTPLIVMLRSLGTGEEREVKTRLGYIEWQRWFPDGRSLLVSGGNPEERSNGLYRLDVASGRSTLLKSYGDTGWVDVPAIASDGKTAYLIRLQSESGKPCRLCAWNVESGEMRELLEHEKIASPTLSPDGRLLAMFRREGDSDIVEILNAAGGDRREVFRVRTPEAKFYLAGWSADGSQIIACTRSQTGGVVSSEVWRIPLQGGAVATAKFPSPWAYYPTLHPDGRRLGYDVGGEKYEYWALENFLPKSEK